MCVALAIALAATGCSGSTRSTSSPTSTSSSASTTAATSVSRGGGGDAPPTAAQIDAQLAKTHEAETPGTTFSTGGPAVTVADGAGGYLTAVPALRNPSADGHGWLLFFWHNQTFLGWDTNRETWNVDARADGTTIGATYPRYASNDPACCPSLAPITISYHWNGERLAQDQPLPSGAIVGISVVSD